MPLATAHNKSNTDATKPLAVSACQARIGMATTTNKRDSNNALTLPVTNAETQESDRTAARYFACNMATRGLLKPANNIAVNGARNSTAQSAAG